MLVSWATLVAAQGCDQKRQEVIASIQELSRALANRDGERAASLYSRNSIEYYDRMVKAARTATRDEIAKMPWLDRLEILVLRHRLPAADLRTIDGERYIRTAVAQGWWLHRDNDRIPEDLDFDRVTIKINGSMAWLDLELDEGSLPGISRILASGDKKRYLRYYKEGDDWRLDQTAVHELRNELLGRWIIAQHDGDHEGLLMRLEERMSGRSVDRSIWDPPRR